jgi:hypothetical protein
VLRIRKYFLQIRIRIRGSPLIRFTDPDPGGQLITDPSRSGSYLDMLWQLQKNVKYVAKLFWYILKPKNINFDLIKLNFLCVFENKVRNHM